MTRSYRFRWHLLGNLTLHVLLLLAYQIRIWMTLHAWPMYMSLPCGPLAFRKLVYLPLKIYSVPMCSMVEAVGNPASSVDDVVYVFIALSILFWSCITLCIHILVRRLTSSASK